MRSPSARFLLMTPIWFIAPSVFAEDGVSERLMPYVMFDVATEKDAASPLKNEYFNKHITVGVKTPKKWEYSLPARRSRHTGHASRQSTQRGLLHERAHGAVKPAVRECFINDTAALKVMLPVQPNALPIFFEVVRRTL